MFRRSTYVKWRSIRRKLDDSLASLTTSTSHLSFLIYSSRVMKILRTKFHNSEFTSQTT